MHQWPRHAEEKMGYQNPPRRAGGPSPGGRSRSSCLPQKRNAPQRDSTPCKKGKKKNKQKAGVGHPSDMTREQEEWQKKGKKGRPGGSVKRKTNKKRKLPGVSKTCLTNIRDRWTIEPLEKALEYGDAQPIEAGARNTLKKKDGDTKGCQERRTRFKSALGVQGGTGLDLKKRPRSIDSCNKQQKMVRT